jgi:hypothetical protein
MRRLTMSDLRTAGAWLIGGRLLTEEEAANHYSEYSLRKTGRQFEV